MFKKIKPYQICEIAIPLFKEFGFHEVTMQDIAKKAAISESELFSFFGNKHDIVLFLFQRINADWELLVDNISSKKIADRLEEALLLKVSLVQPYVGFLGQIIGLLIENSKIGIKAPRTSHIRRMGQKTMQTVIDQSTDGKKLQTKIKQLPSLLYLMHWAVLFVYVQSNDQTKTNEMVKVLAKSFKHPKSLLLLKNLFPHLGDLQEISSKIIESQSFSSSTLDREILKIIFNYRKTTQVEDLCISKQCDTCFELHEQAINFYTRQNLPIHFILPAFPAKSPNRSKTLGTMPDLGEEIALKTLSSICDEIKSIYHPGAQITICSDGRIFSELVAVSDEEISLYVSEIKKMIQHQGITNISIINLEDVAEGDTFEEMRTSLLENYAESIEIIKTNIKNKPEAKSLFNGIHRFISEDRLAMNSDKSKSKIKEESKLIAIKVIQHSNAWTRFLVHVFPEAIRLSIHPYPAHYSKIGIQLTKADDNWLTPWHGVITLRENNYVLMKRSEAEQLRAALVYRGNQPYFYTLSQEE